MNASNRRPPCGECDDVVATFACLLRYPVTNSATGQRVILQQHVYLCNSCKRDADDAGAVVSARPINHDTSEG